MTKCLTIVFAISLALSVVNCGSDGGTCDEAYGIINKLCEGDMTKSEFIEGCKEALAEMPQEQIDLTMSCLRKSTTEYEAGACVGEEDICDG